MNKKQLYENIMKNVAFEVKRALNEETVNEESKVLTPEEKIDMWIAGDREVNVKACSADKLRDYYKLCKQKDFDKGMQAIEAVAKSKNVKLDESAVFYKEIEVSTCRAKIKARKGFMMYDPDTMSVTVYQYDDIEDLNDLGINVSDDDFYDELDALNVGETAIDYVNNAIHTRIQ